MSVVASSSHYSMGCCDGPADGLLGWLPGR